MTSLNPSQSRISLDKAVPVEKIQGLTEAVGWGRRGDALWHETLSKSAVVCSLWDKDRLIAFGRIVEDGVMCMFYDIAVHPEYQRRGLGTLLMNTLINEIKDKSYVSIGLFGWEGNPANVDFYQSLGFEVVPTGMELTKFMKREG